jgi:hypothetical protein
MTLIQISRDEGNVRLKVGLAVVFLGLENLLAV